jgi:hypothetical protein
MAYRGRSARATSPSRVLGYVALVVLAAAAGGLTVLALSSDRDPDDTVPVYTPGAQQPNSPLADEPLAPSGRAVVAVDAETAWRYSAGQCGVEAPTLALSEDGGGDWTSAALPPAFVEGQVYAGSILDGALRLSGLAGDVCATSGVDAAVGFAASADGWQDTPPSLAWSLDRSSGSVLGPSGAVAAPCVVVDVDARADTDVVVLCADQSIVRSNDAGASWGQPLAVVGAVAVAADAEGFLVAAGYQDACSGITIIELGVSPDDTSGTVRGCAPVAYIPEQTAMDARGAAVWVWAGDDTATSADGGATWR